MSATTAPARWDSARWARAARYALDPLRGATPAVALIVADAEVLALAEHERDAAALQPSERAYVLEVSEVLEVLESQTGIAYADPAEVTYADHAEVLADALDAADTTDAPAAHAALEAHGLAWADDVARALGEALHASSTGTLDGAALFDALAPHLGSGRLFAEGVTW